MGTPTLEKVASYDGTPIAYYRSGTGPPLVLVAGTGAANTVAWPVVPELAKQFTVYAVDRRGHGESGDSPAYAVEREFEDIAAVIASIREPANLLGHSFGGLCALEAALLTQNIRRLVLYEGVPWGIQSGRGIPVYPQGFLDRLQALLDAGDREGILIKHYTENAGLTLAEIEQFRKSPAWPERVATAHTIPRELQADEQYRLDPGRFKDLHLPILLLLGGDSPEIFKDATELANASLPNSQIAVMPGQQHIAMYTNPELFVSVVLQFLQPELTASPEVNP